MSLYPESMEKLIIELSNLPTIGRKSARRLALRIVEMDEKQVARLAESLMAVKEKIHPCSICGNLAEEDTCSICRDQSRDRETVTVVEDSGNIISLEKTHQYNGLYHVLGGVISPRDNINPEELRIDSLLERVENEPIHEIILAISPTVDGDLTMNFIGELLKGKDVRLTKLASGVPIGADLEYFDEMSILNALQNRTEII